MRRIDRVALLTCAVVVSSVITASAAEIALVWNDNSPTETGFLIERRSQGSTTFSSVGAGPADVTEFVDAGLPAGATYCYRVRAYNVAGASAPTGEVCGTASTPRIPLSLTLSAPELSTREVLIVTVNAAAGIITSPVDAYVVVQLADGSYYSLQLNGSVVPGAVPMARSVVLPTASLSFALPLQGAPPGAYSWLAVATQPGTLTPVTPIERTAFSIRP